MTPSKVFTVNGVKVGVIGAALEDDAGAGVRGRDRGADVPRRGAADRGRVRAAAPGRACSVQVVVIHEGTANGSNAVGTTPGVPWDGPILAIADQLQDTTVDAMVVGHTHRISNLMRGDILITEGINAGASYSVLQLMVQGGDVAWAGGATRVAKTLGVAPRADVQAIVDEANAETAVLRNQVIGTQADRHPARPRPGCFESEMGNMVADAMRVKYPGVEAAHTNSGGLRADLVCSPPSAGEQPCEITWGEMFAVLPFGNRTVILTLTGAQLEQALLNGFSPVCNPAIATGRFPQVSGLRLTFTCNGTTPVVTGMWKTPDGIGGTADADRADRHRPPRHERLHVHRRRRLHALAERDRRAAAG